MTAPRIREAGDAALLLQLDAVIDPAANARVVAIAERIRERRVPGVRDVLPTFHSVAVYFDPLATDVSELREVLEAAARESAPVSEGRTIEVPVVYGGEAGPDLDEVAALAGLTPREVIAAHAQHVYRVYMLGFLPGFAYMGLTDERIAAPRRSTPRLRVPAGSVGLAGRQTAVYPVDSPGGWRIIGRTPTRVFDPRTTPPALFSPGDSVRFVPAASATSFDTAVPTPAGEVASGAGAAEGRALTVLRPGLLTTVQDSGRWGHLSSGTPVSGPMDLVSHRVANLLVGNDDSAAALEVTLIGPELRAEQSTRAAIAGADLQPTLDGAAVPSHEPFTWPAGAVLRFGQRRAGARAYVACDGGFETRLVLGSRATHASIPFSGSGGRLQAANERLPLGAERASSGPPSTRRVTNPVVMPRGGARLRVLRGPQEDLFGRDAFDALQHSRFIVGPQSNRMGYRLSGGVVPHTPVPEWISDATFTGAVQVPPSGEPIVLMTDRQTTGGYPQMATVITADLPLAGQLAPGDWIEFELCSREDALAALAAQEGTLRAGL